MCAINIAIAPLKLRKKSSSWPPKHSQCALSALTLPGKCPLLGISSVYSSSRWTQYSKVQYRTVQYSTGDLHLFVSVWMGARSGGILKLISCHILQFLHQYRYRGNSKLRQLVLLHYSSWFLYNVLLNVTWWFRLIFMTLTWRRLCEDLTCDADNCYCDGSSSG